MVVPGSSPLARGLHKFNARKGTARRIIPARAGFTFRAGSARTATRDHPRSRGVYCGAARSTRRSPGSSPLARGLRQDHVQPVCDAGIIPARAGFTDEETPGRARRGDHPRSRGVYASASGSRRRDSWIIPARAGFTPPSYAGAWTTGDHPRSRGVYQGRGGVDELGQGSSPLARGLRQDAAQPDVAVGIIPARAGFTSPTMDTSSAFRDHPRSRGVYGGVAVVGQVGDGIIPARAGFTDRHRHRPHPLRGSSPLARGLLGGIWEKVKSTGIIPARAGFTRSWSGLLSRGGDHPRSRGVYPRPDPRERIREGSSPLARGLRGLDIERVGREGIIPARAGFTIASPRRIASAWDHPRSRGV